ncbi:L-threonylcarbamoyladenylate synthase [Candidatus Neomarinimicrobiota bacterium]
MNRISISDSSCISCAIDVIQSGGIIVYPTDTLYGFGVDATNAKAIRKLNKIKERSGPISIIAPNYETACLWIDQSVIIFIDLEHYIGGAKTLIAPIKNEIVDELILGKDGSAGIRIPNSQFCRELGAIYKNPYTTTSVNLSGKSALNSPDQIEKVFSNKIDLLVDAGDLPESGGSTIYKIAGDSIEIIRKN